ncbi:putative leucine-rich repeat-containing protein DDB_G0290503 isoform X5 [Cherax quadricarinatus]|uniref:putative leucine-rich repeat-containing protein DDB_G0290503 isoform X5 n=1 Tax=Cherax quadricarinatus TaxID=27406 RepID=UPI002379DFDD|nr:coiled-coil domain-containing protein 18-like isoform X5 [Cherax quadricarinatus]
MIRRGSGRTPPFILVGLVLIVLILGFNYWTLSSQNADLQQEVEKLQAELKISAMKQEQSETKNAALQETVHEMDSISANLKKKLEEEKDVLKSKDHDNQKKEYEITSLKNKLVKLQEHIDTITQQLEDHEAELSKAKETNIHLATERDDAVEAIAEKDALINTLKRQLEQEKSRSSALQYSVDSLKKKVTQTFGELTACQDKFSDIETLAKSLKAKEQKEKSRNGILKTNVDTLNIKLANTVAELTECQDSVSKLKASTVAHETEHVKAQDEIAAAEHEKLAIVQPKIVPGPMNLPSVEYKALSQNGANIGHDNAAVDTLVAPQPINHGNSNDVNLHVDQGNPQIQAPAKIYNGAAPLPEFHGLAKPRYGLVTRAQVLQHPRVKPVQGPAVVEQPAVKNRPVIEPMIPGNVDGQDPQKDVLAPPPQHQEDSNVMNAKSDGNVSELDKHIREAETQLRDEEIQNDRYRAFQDQMKPSKVQKHKEKVVSLIGKYHRQTEDIRGKTHTLKRIDEPQVQHKYDDADHNNAQEQIDEPQAQHEHDDMAQNNAQEQIDEPQAPHEEQDDNAHNNAQEQIDEPQTRHEAQDENHNNAQEQIDVPEISQANGHPGHE